MSAPAYKIRPAEPEDAAGIAEVHGASWDESYRGLLPDEVIDAQLAPDGFRKRWRERLTGPTGSPARTLVAVAEDAGESRLVGFVSAGPSRDGDTGCPGEIWALYLVRKYQGLGIGRALWNAGVAELAQRGLLPGQVVVLAKNPTLDFYRHVGGVEIARAPCRHEWAGHLEEVSLRFEA